MHLLLDRFAHYQLSAPPSAPLNEQSLAMCSGARILAKPTVWGGGARKSESVNSYEVHANPLLVSVIHELAEVTV